jgi:hypothetical protein
VLVEVPGMVPCLLDLLHRTHFNPLGEVSVEDGAVVGDVDEVATTTRIFTDHNPFGVVHQSRIGPVVPSHLLHHLLKFQPSVRLQLPQAPDPCLLRSLQHHGPTAQSLPRISAGTLIQ